MLPGLTVDSFERGARDMTSPNHSRVRRAFAGALGAVSVLLFAVPSTAARARRPTVHSFITRDEGARIHFGLTFCEQDLQTGAGDTYAATFRMWNAKGKPLAKRQVSARLDGRCGTASLFVADRFPAGNYWANVAITNVTRQSFSRIKARPFVITESR